MDIIIGLFLAWLSLKKVEHYQETRSNNLQDFFYWLKEKYWDKPKNK